MSGRSVRPAVMASATAAGSSARTLGPGQPGARAGPAAIRTTSATTGAISGAALTTSGARPVGQVGLASVEAAPRPATSIAVVATAATAPAASSTTRRLDGPRTARE